MNDITCLLREGPTIDLCMECRLILLYSYWKIIILNGLGWISGKDLHQGRMELDATLVWYFPTLISLAF